MSPGPLANKGVTYVFFRVFGRFLAWLPRPVVGALCEIAARVGYAVNPPRRRITQDNVRSFFPDRDPAFHRRITRAGFRTLVEMALMGFALAFFSERRLKRDFVLETESACLLREVGADDKPVLLLVPHTTQMEILVATGLWFPWMKNVRVIYQSIPDPGLDCAIRASREAFGMTLLPREKGLLGAARCLQKGYPLSILFDQNAGEAGTMIPFGNRLASATEFPNLLANRFPCQPILLWTERTACWKGRIHARRLAGDNLTAAAHQWLEEHLRSDDLRASDWLWTHDRWGHEPTTEAQENGRPSYPLNT